MSLSIDLDKGNMGNGNLSATAKAVADKKRTSVIGRDTSKMRPTPPRSKSRFANLPKKRILKFIFLFLIISIIGGGGFTLWQAKRAAAEAGIDIKLTDIIDPVKKDPQLKRDSSGKRTNALIVGIDTRETYKGLLNTDTMIIASYNHETKETIMISIPRDFMTEVPGEQWYNKSNGIYATFETKEKGTGLPALQKSLEDLVGLEIQYYGMVDLKAFTDIIDIIGGITVDVENTFTDYAYPAPEGSGKIYEAVSFTAGPQTMDGATALKYARSRKSQMNGEGSDYARAKRQQNVINAVKNKLASSETFLSPEKIFGLMNTLADNITLSNVNTEEIQAAINIMLDADNIKTHSFVMSPAIGGGQLVATGVAENLYATGPAAGLGKYDPINQFVQLILVNPALYEANPIVYVYDTGIGYTAAAAKAEEIKKQFPYLRVIYAGTLFSDKEGDVIYDNSGNDSNSLALKEFNEYLKFTNLKKPEYVTSGLNGEDITILLGKVPPAPAAETTPASE